jgi:hypothetical protein
MGNSSYRGYNGSGGKGSIRSIDPYAPRWGKAARSEARAMLMAGAPPEKVAAYFGVSVRKVRKLGVEVTS